MTPPKVFISYSHDSPEHSERVLALSDRLREDGIDCHIDQYEVFPPEGWPLWMENRIEWADFVLVVCTETYNLRFRGKAPSGEGKGVTWERAILTNKLYEAKAYNTRFIPIVFSSQDTAHIPIILKGQTHYDVSKDKGYEALYRHLTNQPLVLKPSLGKLKSMPPLKPKHNETSPEKNKPVAGEETQKELERRVFEKTSVTRASWLMLLTWGIVNLPLFIITMLHLRNLDKIFVTLLSLYPNQYLFLALFFPFVSFFCHLAKYELRGLQQELRNRYLRILVLVLIFAITIPNLMVGKLRALYELPTAQARTAIKTKEIILNAVERENPPTIVQSLTRRARIYKDFLEIDIDIFRQDVPRAGCSDREKPAYFE